jgi:hypothetical protein
MTLSSLNAVCPYFTMFPIEFPMRVLAKEQGKSKWVYDPFCGRGTTNFAARLKGLPSVGIDSSPIATAIAEAKVVTTTFQAVVRCAQMILQKSPYPKAIPNQLFWKHAYSEDTLIDICHIREELIRNCKSPARKALRAIMLGALHGPRSKGLPSYFSNQCPRTFSPKPAYASKFWEQRNLKAPVVDVMGIIRRRAERYLSTQLPNVNSTILQQDSREWVDTGLKGLFSWVITSPPYYGMRTYMPDQWLRNWFIGGPSTVGYESRPTDFQHSSPERFSQQLRQVWLNTAAMSAANASLACRFGGIHDRKQDCIEILKSSFRDSGWRLTTIRDAGSALDGRRQATQFGEDQKKHPRQEYDVYARRDD